MSDEAKLRVLVIAEAANPEWTSVPLIGWSHSKALRGVCNAHLVTQIRNREAISRAGWREGEDFSVIDSEKIIAPLYRFATFLRGGKNLGWTITTALASIGYPYFEYLCWKKFKTRLKNGEFDVVHRVTPVSPTAPSILASKLKNIDVPFVVGPLNGGVAWPPEFRDLQHKEREWLSHVRNFYKLIPGYRSLRKNASCIIAGSMATKADMPEYTQNRLLYLPENAIDPSRFSLKNQSQYELPLKAAFVGRLVPYKGADIAIDAMVDLCRQGKMEYDIYGSGPEEQSLRAKVAELNLEHAIRVHGFVPNEELQNRLVQADLLVFPSIREFGGGVVLEAMALGVVPVIADYAGPAELVSGESGYLVAMGNRHQLVSNLRETLQAIVANTEALPKLRQACTDKIAKYYTWQRKAEQLLDVYRWVVGLAPRPDFNRPFSDEHAGR